MTIAQLRDKVKAAVNGVTLASPFSEYDFIEGYLSDMNNVHNRTNPLCILSIFKTTEDRNLPIADHTISLKFLYPIPESMQTELVQYSQDYYHTLFSQFDTDINSAITLLLANDDINLKSNITRSRTPYNGVQKLWLINVEFTIQTHFSCYFT